MTLKIQPGIMDIAPYVGGESALAGKATIIKLSSNENALGASTLALQAYADAAAKLCRYPDGGASRLREAIGAVYGLAPERIVCGAGSDELIALLCMAYAGAGDEVILTEHGFLMYPISALKVGATPVKVPEKDLRTDVDAILQAVTARTRIVFLANPNNPTGSYIGTSELTRLCDGLPKDVLLVLDGAYAEYVTEADYTAGVDLVDRYANVVMTRTFSKIYGLASLRLGWMYASLEVADVLNRVRGPFNISGAAIDAGVAAVCDQDFVKKSCAFTAKERNTMAKALAALGLSVFPSVANFLLVGFPSTAQATAADLYLRKEGIIVRKVVNYGLPDALRITIGTEEENRQVVAVLERFVRG